MKEKIIMFVIGTLFGAVIATGAFYIYTTANNSCSANNTQMNGNQPPEMPSGQNSQNGQPPEKPNGDNGKTPQQSTENNTQESN